LRSAALFGALACASPVHADYPAQVQSIANLVGYWRFEAAADSSVGGYTGSFIGDAAVGDASSGPTFVGVADNHAALFDGNGDGVLTDLAGQVTFATAGTIVAWVYLDVQPSSAGRTLYVAGRSQTGDDMDLQIDTDNRARFYTTGGGGVAAPAALPLHQWVMVAASFDTQANTRSLYLDGNLVATDTPGSHSGNSAPLSIAYSTVFGGRWFQGAIDEVAIYDRALTDAEIRDLEDAAGDLIFRSGFEY
jgi:hypothetical protein